MTATNLPVVMTGGPDPIASGFVSNLARPGGSVTGVGAKPGTEVFQKRVQFLRQIAPTVSWIACMANLSLQGVSAAVIAAGSAAAQLGLQWKIFDPRTPSEIPSAFEAARAWGADALYIFGSNPTGNARAQVVGLAADYRSTPGPAISRSRRRHTWAGREYPRTGHSLTFRTRAKEPPPRGTSRGSCQR
jgi:putative ABC transport system substrate-binding protein